jgi:hypothetical protein
MFDQEFGSQTMAQVVMQKSCFSVQRIDKPWFLNYNKDLIKNEVDGEDVTSEVKLYYNFERRRPINCFNYHLSQKL